MQTGLLDESGQGLISQDQDDDQLDRKESLEDLGMNFFTGITSICFPYIDPIGTMLVAFDDGTIKLWRSTVKNEQYMKILELQQPMDLKSTKKSAA